MTDHFCGAVLPPSVMVLFAVYVFRSIVQLFNTFKLMSLSVWNAMYIIQTCVTIRCVHSTVSIIEAFGVLRGTHVSVLI